MTIPSRPAPAPPGSRGQNAAAGANATLEQLRLQLQQQQLQQQQQHQQQKLAIKLPPPPKGRPSVNGINNNYSVASQATSITRKFPQARYTPATDWDDSPFSQQSSANASTNGNLKKMPPPRPPPPKVQVNGVARKSAPPVAQSTNILSNIFKKKSTSKTKTTCANGGNGAARVYGVSSGNYASTTSATSSHSSCNSAYSYSSGLSNGSAGGNWNAAWNSASFTTSITNNTANNHTNEGQLISFDSPPSSPTFTQKSNSDCLSVDSFSSDSNFSSPNNGSVSQPESGFEDDFSRSRPATTSPLDPWETLDAFGPPDPAAIYNGNTTAIGTAPVRNLNNANTRIHASTDNPLCNGKSLLPPTPSLNAPTIIKPKISQKPKAPKPPILHAKPTMHNTDLPTPPSPPMPQCAPPPPPPPAEVTLLDVISGRVDAIHLSAAGASVEFSSSATSAPYGIALYNFEGVEEGDLNFRENEKIYLLERVSEEWYRGRTRSGCEGIFPGNYIDIKVPLTAQPPAQSTTTCTASAYIATTNAYHTQQQNAYNSSQTLRVRCLYNFPAEVEGDLALKENELVTILYKINEDWLYGEIDGRQGQFPSNFLEYVPDNIPMP